VDENESTTAYAPYLPALRLIRLFVEFCDLWHRWMHTNCNWKRPSSQPTEVRPDGQRLDTDNFKIRYSCIGMSQHVQYTNHGRTWSCSSTCVPHILWSVSNAGHKFIHIVFVVVLVGLLIPWYRPLRILEIKGVGLLCCGRRLFWCPGRHPPRGGPYRPAHSNSKQCVRVNTYGTHGVPGKYMFTTWQCMRISRFDWQALILSEDQLWLVNSSLEVVFLSRSVLRKAN